MKLLLLDMDGTVREPASGAKFISRPDDQRIIDGAQEVISLFHEAGWAIVGITNQGGVAAGFKDFHDAVKEQRFTLDLLPQISLIYFCPWAENEDSGCFFVEQSSAASHSHEIESIPGSRCIGFRKPNPGMLLRAMFDKSAEPSEVLYVGDRPEDEQAAIAAGVNFMWAEDWRKLEIIP